MAMKPECMAAVKKAAGGTITQAKLRAVESAIDSKMRQLARNDRQRWSALSRDQRVSEATVAAMEEVQTAAKLKEYRGILQMLRTAETESRVAGHQKLNGLSRSLAWARDMEQADIDIHAIRNRAMADLTALIDAATSHDGKLASLGRRIFDLADPQMTADIVREVYRLADGHTSNAAAKAAARAWLDTIEAMRQRFNAAGGDIGRLGYGYLGQMHDAARVRAAGAERWAARALDLIDREQYVHADGRLMNAAEVLEVLKGAHETIATGGANKRTAGARSSAVRASHGADSRVIHFRNGEAWMAYMREFGEGSLYDAMIGHVNAMARDIGLVERYGPNTEMQAKVQLDIAERADGKGGRLRERLTGATLTGYWDVLSGKSATADHELIARIGQGARNIQTAAKLGGAVVSATTDMGTIAAMLHFNRLPYFDMLANVARTGSAEVIDFARTHAVIGESLVTTLNRFTGDYMTHSLTGRAANAVMKLSLMNAWTDGLRRAFSLTMMQALARNSTKAWGQLDEWDRYLLERKGITGADWGIVQRAQLTEFRGQQFLTPEAIIASGHADAVRVAEKIVGHVTDEAQFAVVNPDLRTRVIVSGGGSQRGTMSGEAWRSFAQFKSFPIAVLTRHWRRVLETPQGLEGAPLLFGAKSKEGAVVNRIAFLAALNVTMMMLGALVLQNKALLQRKDPYDMTDGRFWMRAVAQGGGMGYLGDLLFKDPTEQRGNKIEQMVGTVLGPVAGSAAGLVGDVGIVNVWQHAKGEDTDLGAEALRWTNSQLPGVWWTRPMWEQWFLHSAQEALNPGYLGRMKKRAQRDWGQSYWWEPGEALPERPPDLGAVAQ